MISIYSDKIRVHILSENRWKVKNTCNFFENKVESLSAELLFGMSPDGFDQKEQKEKPSDWMVFFLVSPNNFEPNIYINNPVNLTLLFNVSTTVNEIILFPFVSSFSSAFFDADFTKFSICPSCSMSYQNLFFLLF